MRMFVFEEGDFAANFSSNFTETWEIALFASSGFFAFFAVIVSAFLIYRHLKHWTEPKSQTYIVRILIMTPVYAVDSWLSIRFVQYSLYINIARDCYEAYVLYQFFALLICYFENSECDEGETIDDKIMFYEGKWLMPLCCIPKFQASPLFLIHIKRCILQYVIIKPLCSIVAIGLEIGGHYEEGVFVPWAGYLWITIILNASVFLSLYALVLFYEVIADVLKPYRPILKLMSIKAIIAAVFWQTVILAALGYFDVIPSLGEHWSKEHVASAINNFIICFEMLILAIAHIWIFPYDEYRPEERLGEGDWKKTKNVLTRLTRDVVNQTDMAKDTKDAFSPKEYQKVKEKHKLEKEKFDSMEDDQVVLGSSYEDDYSTTLSTLSESVTTASLDSEYQEDESSKKNKKGKSNKGGYQNL